MLCNPRWIIFVAHLVMASLTQDITSDLLVVGLALVDLPAGDCTALYSIPVFLSSFVYHTLRHLSNCACPYLIHSIIDMEGRSPKPISIHIVPQRLDRRAHDGPRRLMVVRIVRLHEQTILRPPELSSSGQQPVASSLEHVHDGIVGRVEQNHDPRARDGTGDSEDDVRFAAGGTPQYGIGTAAGSETVRYCLNEIIAAVEHTEYSPWIISYFCLLYHTTYGDFSAPTHVPATIFGALAQTGWPRAATADAPTGPPKLEPASSAINKEPATPIVRGKNRIMVQKDEVVVTVNQISLPLHHSQP